MLKALPWCRRDHATGVTMLQAWLWCRRDHATGLTMLQVWSWCRRDDHDAGVIMMQAWRSWCRRDHATGVTMLQAWLWWRRDHATGMTMLQAWPCCRCDGDESEDGFNEGREVSYWDASHLKKDQLFGNWNQFRNEAQKNSQRGIQAFNWINSFSNLLTKYDICKKSLQIL